MAKSKKPSLPTLKGSAAHPPPQEVLGLSIDMKLVQKAALEPDESKAQEAVRAYVEAMFEAAYGAKRAQIDYELEVLLKEKKHLDEAQDALAADISGEDHLVSVAPEEKMPFWRWSLRDKIESILYGLGMTSAMGGALYTTQANLMASGHLVFLDHPFLALTIGGVSPLAAMGVKLLVTSFKNAAKRARLIAALHSAMGTAILIWVVLFAQQYHGMGGSFDVFAETNGTLEIAFVVAQLLTEILIGAALAVRLTLISERYAPDCHRPNEKRAELVRIDARAKDDAETLHAEIATKKAELAGIEAQLKAAQEAASINLAAYQAQLKSLPF